MTKTMKSLFCPCLGGVCTPHTVEWVWQYSHFLVANLNRFIIIGTAAGGVQVFHLIYHIIWSQAEDPSFCSSRMMLPYTGLSFYHSQWLRMRVPQPEEDDFQSVFKEELSVFPASHQMALTRIHYPTSIVVMSRATIGPSHRHIYHFQQA